jgi:hypothetical protein
MAELIYSDSGGNTATQQLIVTKIRGAVAHRVSSARMNVESSTHDYGHMVAHTLTLWLARLPQQGTLEVSWPASWWQHFKRDFVATNLPTLCGWSLRRWPVKLATHRYEASHYLPAVKVPDELDHDDFYLWREISKERCPPTVSSSR